MNAASSDDGTRRVGRIESPTLLDELRAPWIEPFPHGGGRASDHRAHHPIASRPARTVSPYRKDAGNQISSAAEGQVRIRAGSPDRFRIVKQRPGPDWRPGGAVRERTTPGRGLVTSRPGHFAVGFPAPKEFRVEFCSWVPRPAFAFRGGTLQAELDVTGWRQVAIRELPTPPNRGRQATHRAACKRGHR